MFPLRDTVRARSFPIVNWLLITINVLIFIVLIGLGPQAEVWATALGVIPSRLLQHFDLHNALTLLTSMFLHGGWAHLFSNMFALYIFGDNVEDRMGSGRYLLFYLFCGVVAALVHVAFNPHSSIPTVGASGAISGVLAAYLIFFPLARVITLVPLFFLPWFVEIPAILYIGLWFISQLLNGFLTIVSGMQAFGGVAWWAHVGGFVAGLAVAPFFGRRRYARRMYWDEYFPW